MRIQLIFMAALLAAGCNATNYTQRGSAVGGLGGAGLGALIGEIAADNPLAGAAIGGSVGALTGASVGAGLDEVDAANRSRVAHAAYQQEIAGVTLSEVVSLSAAGLSDDIIVRHVRSKGFAGVLGANELIALRQQGVSDRVIADLQTLSRDSQHDLHSATESLSTSVAPSVVVEERYVPAFGPCGPPRHLRFRHARPGFHWGIAFGH